MKNQIQLDWLRKKLDKSENSGFTNDSKEEILRQSKGKLKR